MRVVVTRPEGDAQAWANGLQAAGYEPVLLPLISIGPAPDPSALQQAWGRLHEYAAVMFVSGNAVNRFFQSKPASTLVFKCDSAIKTRAYATGPGTTQALLQWGVEAAMVDAPPPDASQFDSQALWAAVHSQVGPGSRVLIVRGAGGPGNAPDGAVPNGAGRNWFADQLREAGAQVDFLVSYQRTAPVFDGRQQDLARAAAIDGSIWLFSSSEAIGNLASAMPGQPWTAARAIATHARIADTARGLGFGVVCESRPALASVVASIESMA